MPTKQPAPVPSASVGPRVSSEQAVDAFKALANPVRFQILEWLRDPRANFPIERGIADPDIAGVCVTQIREKVGLAQSTVSAYMTTLERAGLVISTRIGKWTHYRRSEDTIAQVSSLLGQEAPGLSTHGNIVGVLARAYVADLDSALPLYEQLTGEPTTLRFKYARMRLAKVGVFLLVEGAPNKVRTHSATIDVLNMDRIVAALTTAGGELIEGPAQGPNGARLIARHPDGNVFEYIETAKHN